MCKVGFIGYGSMGEMLINQLIQSDAIESKNIIVANRTATKMDSLKEKNQEIKIALNNREVIRYAKYIFICTKPFDMKVVIDEIKDFVTPETHLILTTATITTAYVDKHVKTKVSKLMPSITTEVRDGISLIYHNDRVSKDEARFIEALLNKITTLKAIKEENFDLASEITSCGPGLIAGILNEFLESATRHTDSLDRGEIEDMLVRTLYGTARLFAEKNMSFAEVVSRVATKGGVTEEGVKVLKMGLPDTFDKMFEQTLIKRKLMNAKIEELL